MEIACLGEMVDALVLTGGLEQVARRPNARHEGEERRHSRVFVAGGFVFYQFNGQVI